MTFKIKDVPQWAIHYIETGSIAGLSIDEEEMINDWMYSVYSKGKKLIRPLNTSYGRWSKKPQFGGPCITSDYLAEQ